MTRLGETHISDDDKQVRPLNLKRGSHDDSAAQPDEVSDPMALFTNQAPVSNQVGGNQNVHGSIYNAPVTILQPAAGSHRVEQAASVDDPAIYDSDILHVLAFPTMFDRRSNVDPPHANSCRWIQDLTQFKQWKAHTRGLLWIKGNPGVGKSVLMAHLYQELKTSRSPEAIYLDFFFNARGDELQKTAIGMLRSLLNQLFRQDPQSRPPIRSSYREKREAFGRSSGPPGTHPWDFKRQELEALLVQSIVLSAQSRYITIFVDALDEAGEKSAREIAQYLHRLNDRISANSAHCSICISSRHHPVSCTVASVEIIVENHNRDDIAAYVHDHLKLEDRTLEDTPDLDQWYGLKRHLVDQANGIFQWISLVVPILEQYLDYGDSLQEARKFLAQVPAGLESVYEHIIYQVIDPRYRSQAYLLFQWVCLAEQPLSVTTLRYALAAGYARPSPSQIRCSQSPHFIRTDKLMRLRLQTLSGGLVAAVDDRLKNSGLGNDVANADRSGIPAQAGGLSEGDFCVVQTIHQTAADFLLAKGLSILAFLLKQSNNPTCDSNLVYDHEKEYRHAHAMMYWSCLRYLCSEEPQETAKIISSEALMPNCAYHVYSFWKASDGRIDSAPLLFWHYALTWLPVHALEARDFRGNDKQLQAEMIKSVLTDWESCILTRATSLSDKNDGPTTLHVAAVADLIDLFEHLVKDGPYLEARNAAGCTALHLAVLWGHEAMAKLLVSAGSAFDARTHLGVGPYQFAIGTTPLVMAAARGYANIVFWLLELSKHRASSTTVSTLTGTKKNKDEDPIDWALTIAAENGQLEVVRILINAGAKLNMNMGEFGTPLQAASRFGHGEIVKSLIEAQADVNVLGGRYGSALMAACRSGDVDIVRSLLRSGAVVNIITEGRKAFALQQACEKGHMRIVKLLLSHDADVNLSGGTYGSALHAAAFYQHDDIVRLLLDAGAQVNAVGGRYGTVLLTAASFNNSISTVKLLLDAGADINARGDTPYTPLQLACSRPGSDNLIRFLIDAGADINAAGESNGTALQAAVLVSCDVFNRLGPSAVVRMLVDAGADVNAPSGGEGTALQIAQRFKDEPMLTYLRSCGAIETGDGITQPEEGESGRAVQTELSI